MKLILVRHGIAEEPNAKASWGHDDDLRPLTEQGRTKIIQAAHVLKQLCPKIDRIFSSELVRAKETATLINQYYQLRELGTHKHLVSGGDLELLADWLSEFEDPETLLCVSHEPSISSFASYLLSGKLTNFFSFGRGGMACMEFAARAKAGHGILKFFIPSEH